MIRALTQVPRRSLATFMILASVVLPGCAADPVPAGILLSQGVATLELKFCEDRPGQGMIFGEVRITTVARRDFSAKDYSKEPVWEADLISGGLTSLPLSDHVEGYAVGGHVPRDGLLLLQSVRTADGNYPLGVGYTFTFSQLVEGEVLDLASQKPMSMEQWRGPGGPKCG